MIEILNTKDGTVRTFQGYKALFNHIKQLERQRTLTHGESSWHFIQRPYPMLSFLYHRTVKMLENFTSQEREACEKELNLLEICKGDHKNFTQIVITPEVNIDEMKKSWCRDYCLEHDYTLYEKKSD